MKVLHVIPSVAARYGGPSAAIRGMTAAESSAGISVTVATTDADGPDREPVPLDRPVLADGVQYRYFARSMPGEYKFSWPLTKWLRRHVAEYDVLHVHALFSYATIPACRLAHRAGVPYVLRPLGTLGGWSLAHRAWKKTPYLALVERRHLRDAAAVLVTSDAEAAAIAALGFGDRSRLIPLGVDPVGTAALEQRVGLVVERAAAHPRAPLQLLFLSRLHPVKGLPLLIEAIGLLQGRADVQLTVAGEGPTAYVRQLRGAVDRAGLADRVRFVGHLAGEAKGAAFDAADLFVLPSSHENFGISAAEALAHGVPVILTDGVGIANDVRRSGAGVVVAGTSRALADAIARLANDRVRLSSMGRAAVELARREYSWPATAQRLLALYAELTAERETARRQGDRAYSSARTAAPGDLGRL